MLLQAFAHALVSVTIAELGTAAITSNRFHAFSIDSIAGSTTVELIERQELASISGSLLEHHCRSQNAVDWRVLKFVKTSLQLYLDCKKSKVSPSNHSSFYSKIKIYKRKKTTTTKIKSLEGGATRYGRFSYGSLGHAFCSLKYSVNLLK